MTENGFIRTYVKGLDDKIEGGIPKGHIVQIAGPSGSMKSTFAFNIAYNVVKEEKGNSIYITLEQSREGIIRQMKKLNMDIEPFKDHFVVLDIGWLRKELQNSEMDKEIDWMEALINQVKNYKNYMGCDVIIIDSLEALYSICNLHNPRSQLFSFFEKIREMGLTTLLISEMHPDSRRFGSYGIETFLADGLIHLEMEKIGKSVGRFISIVKMREVKHPTDYFPLLIDRDGFKVVTK